MNSLKILIVDDIASNRKLLRTQVEAEGHRVVSASTGVEALEALEREKIDVIISDILMPKMDGYRLCYEVRLSARFEQTPFIFHRATHTSPAAEAASQLTLQAIALETAADAMMITDAKGTILWVNHAFTTLTGYAKEEAIGDTPRIIKSGRHDEAFFREFWSTIKSGQVWRGEFTNRSKDGRIWYDEHTVSPARGTNGEITHFVCVMHDVTERKSLENQVLHAQRLESLADGIAHDLNNLLMPILMAATLIKQFEPSERTQRAVRNIERCVHRGTDLVKQVKSILENHEANVGGFRS